MSYLKRFDKKYGKYTYAVAVTTILLLSILLRFAHYQNRWGLAFDQAHDAIIARYAVDTMKLPLLGPFSSAGPFQTGGEWYWIIMIGTILSPTTVIAPWVFMTMLYVLFVYVCILVGKEVVDKEFGLIVGSLAAVSTAQITQGTNLTNQSPLALFALFALWLFIRFIRARSILNIFLLGLVVGAATSIHLQGAALCLIVALASSSEILSSDTYKRKILICIVAAVGVFVPWAPVFIVDAQQHFLNTKHMLQYFLHDQYKISLDVLGRRWLTFAGVFVPTSWSFIIGAHIVVGYIFIFSSVFLSYILLKSKKYVKEWIYLSLSLVLFFILMRYTRTPLYESFFVFIHPFILFASGVVLYALYRKQPILGAVVLILICYLSFNKDLNEIMKATNTTEIEVRSKQEALLKAYPNKTFILYDYHGRTTSISFPLSLFLATQHKIAAQGLAVGMIATTEATLKYPVITGAPGGYQIVNLQSISAKMLEKEGWGLVTPEEIYTSAQRGQRN
jgi:hypothetical protein